MKYRIVVVLICFYSPIFSQINLVPNPDFEFNVGCPTSVDQINLAEPWFQPRDFSSTDYFNSCASSVICGVPENIGGYQFPHSGLGYGGIILYGDLDYREYLEIELTEVLEADYFYCIELHISLADQSAITPGIIAVNSLSACFTEDSISTTTFTNLPNIPQVNFDTYGMFSDTANWIKIEGVFTAGGGEKFLTIGNFQNNANTDTAIIIYDNTSYGYYFVDDVSVYQCGKDTTSKPLTVPNVFSPNNDGVNDLFIIENLPENSEVEIFNRWGALITEWHSSSNGWDGRTKAGVELNAGVYYYIINLSDGSNKKGFLQIIK